MTRGALMSDDIREVPIRDLLHNLKDSIDSYALEYVGGWQEMIRECMADAQFPALVRALQEHGQLDPICATEWYTSDGEPCWEMGNGHHRLTAAILLGWETITVDFSSSYSSRSDAHLNRWQCDSTYEEASEWAEVWAQEAA